MRTTITGFLSAGVIAFSFAASAADMPVKAPVPMVAPAQYYNWTGFYSATGLGGAWSDVNGTYVGPTALGASLNNDGSKFNYASIIGAQYQFGNWVIGIEGAYNKLLNKEYDTTNSITADCFGTPAIAGITCASRVDNIWTVGARLGYAWDRWMVYGTGGYANGKVYSKIISTPTGGLFTDTDQRHSGWYAGVGAEYYLTKFLWSDLILGLEYQHIDLGTERHLDTIGVGDDVDYDATVDIVRARLVFKWTPGPAAVSSRY
ncbi:outer membrane beta-barrel protein [Xanthobacteraceae bacterium Astr-EGSB]|uniref:outer membrane protein n=1 Tax=Astrobacterium formosum TaxID=3069710 RepID=UPI0027B2D99F|nr:outer membrane beta-barrel protein [Xanthobacteraceae bacterium Astr-EGSB]